MLFVSSNLARSFAGRCMEKIGVVPEHASILADLLVTADERGHYSHGLNRLNFYVRDVSRKLIDTLGDPGIEKETVATAVVNGNNLLGPVVGKFCIDLAIDKAKQCGIGLVTAHNSNHFGIAGWYSMRAMRRGYIGMAFTNTSPVVVPTRAKQPTIGTNAISFSAPAMGNDSFVLDMATSAVALGKVEIQKLKQEELPLGWGVDSEGRDTRNPNDVYENGGLHPLGGNEINSGYKGYGLALAVEILCGILSGASFGPFIRSWKEGDGKANLGQCFIAIDPSSFDSDFNNRLQVLLDLLRGLEPSGNDPVVVAGDVELNKAQGCKSSGGVQYHENIILKLNELAAALGCEQLQCL